MKNLCCIMIPAVMERRVTMMVISNRMKNMFFSLTFIQVYSSSLVKRIASAVFTTTSTIIMRMNNNRE